MTFAAALGASFRAAALVGPVLGLSSGLVLLAIMAISAGFNGDFAVSAPFILGLGGVLGLVIGGPVSWLGAATMLKAASANRRWAGHGAWIAAGAVLGALVGGALGSITGNAEGFTVMTAIVGVLGAAGGWLCRHVLRRMVRELDRVDPAVFA